MRKKQESALGKGLDALIRKDYLDEETAEPGSKISTSPGFDERIIEEVLLEVHKNPRISLWSAKSSAVLRFLKKTKPEFSISKEASHLIEAAVKDKHPEVWKIFEEKGL